MNKVFLYVLILGFPLSALGQKAGVFGGKLWSNNSELQDPYGIGLFVSIPFNSKLSMNLNYAYYSNSRIYSGITSEGFGFSPKEELIESKTKFQSIEASLMYSIIQQSVLSFDIGAGVSTNFLSVSKRGMETGRPVPGLGGNILGISLSAAISAELPTSFPLSLGMIYKWRFLRYTQRATEGGVPPSDEFDAHAVHIAVAYNFGSKSRQ